MPAIDLTRLDRQISALADSLGEPQVFRRGLHELLSSYHLYARKVSKENMPKSFMRHYELPPQVVRQVELGLKPAVLQRPEESLALIDALWEDEYYESRDLAAFMLGQLPLEYAPAAENRITTWLSQPQDRALQAAVLEKAPSSLRSQAKEQWEALLGKLLDSNSFHLQQSGLLALDYDLPARPLSSFVSVYKLLRPFFKQNDPRILSALQDIVGHLARRNPSETVYFLKQVLAESDTHAIEHIMRRYLPFFSPKDAESLREAIGNQARRKLE